MASVIRRFSRDDRFHATHFGHRDCTLCERISQRAAKHCYLGAGLHFAGESFIVDPEGKVLTRGKSLEEDLVLADLDLTACARSTARRLFWRDRRPELYREWLG